MLERVQQGLDTFYAYDAINRLTAITNNAESPVGDITYPLYDQLGNRKEEVNNIVPDNSFHYTYGYDEIYELTQVTDDLQQTQFTYNYDPSGNRNTSFEQGQNSSYQTNNLNQYTFVDADQFSYDANGNLTDDGSCAYSYDYENRLIAVACGLSTVDYTYDPLGRRLTKQGSGSANLTLFIHDGDQIIETYSCDSGFVTCTLRKSFIYSNRIDEPLLVNQPLQNQFGGQTDYYYHQDALGNTVAITNKDATLKEVYQYGPYGDPRFFNAQGDPRSSSSIQNVYLFTGREWDQETQLYYYRRRYYDPDIGRFLSRDPIGLLGQDVNMYRFVLNNSLNFIDPYGLWYVIPGGGFSVGFASVLGPYVSASGGFGFGTTCSGKKFTAGFVRTLPDGFGQVGLAFFSGLGPQFTLGLGDLTETSSTENINIFVGLVSVQFGLEGNELSTVTIGGGPGFGLGATASASTTEFSPIFGSQPANCDCD